MQKVKCISLGLLSAVVGSLTILPCQHAAAELPVFMYCNTVNNQTVTRPDDPILKNSLRFSGVYYHPGENRDVRLAAQGTYYTNEAREIVEGYSDENIQETVFSFADPWNFKSSILNFGSSRDVNTHSFVNTTCGIAKWFVLKGQNLGVPVNLRADIVFDGAVFGRPWGPDSDASACFTHLFNVLNSPTDRVHEYPLVINGCSKPLGHECGPFGWHGTVPDQCFVSDGQTVHRVYYIIRSNPFEVFTGVPFRLNLMLNAAAATSGSGQSLAYSSFTLSRIALAQEFPQVAELTPEGFVVDLDGDPSTRDVATLGSLGYTLIPFTEPSLSSVSPAKAGDARTVTLTVSGEGFMEGAQVKLVRQGEPDIIGMVGKIENNRLIATFELEGKAKGTWDLVVANLPAYPNTTTATLPGAFTIEEAKAPEVWMDIVGRQDVSPWGAYFKILMGNRGNVNAIGTPVIHGIPYGTRFWFYGNFPPNESFEGIKVVTTQEQEYAVLLPTTVIPPGVILELGLWIEHITVSPFTLRAVWED